MAKQSVKVANPTQEELVAQNGGFNVTATPEENEDVNNVVVVGEEVLENQVSVAEEGTVPLGVTETTEVEEAKERTMDCLGLKDHTCRIGGSVIIVTKEKVQTFTAGVATVLQRAGVVIVK